MCAKRVTRDPYAPPPAKSPEQALNALMALCAKAEKSSGDARRLMSRWGVEEGAQEGVLRKLIAERFIDDERYAGAFIREKSRLNGWGIYKIRMELQRKGVAKDIVEEQMELLLEPEKLESRLREMLERKMRTVKYTTHYQLRDKLLRYGASLGYQFSQVSDCVTEMLRGRFEE